MLAGYGNASSSPYQNVFGMTRLNANGTLDTGFGTGGKVQGNGSAFAAGEAGQANAVSIQSDGTIVLAGTSGGDFALARYTSAGVLDTSFGAAGTGRVKTDFAGGSDGIYGMATDAQGRFVVAGYAGADLAVARFHGVTAAATGSTGTSQRLWAQQDANFNVTSIADNSGAVIERYRYTAYGERTVLNASGSTPASGNASVYGNYYGHQGGRADPANGLIHFRHREYSPQLGRWVSRDPAGYTDGLNSSQYVGSRPTTEVDPNGLYRRPGRRGDRFKTKPRPYDPGSIDNYEQALNHYVGGSGKTASLSNRLIGNLKKYSAYQDVIQNVIPKAIQGAMPTTCSEKDRQVTISGTFGQGTSRATRTKT